MRTTILILGTLLLGAPPAALGQHEHSPYAEHGHREIKALGSDEIRGLLEGEGMSLALAAELNGYPGPRHVLALASELELSPEQTERTRDVFGRMDERARQVGGEIVRLERALDVRFAEGTIEATALARLVGEIGRLRAELREAHLAAHLEMMEVLDGDQRAKYRTLRGYATDDA